MRKYSPLLSIASSILLALVYAGLGRFVFGQPQFGPIIGATVSVAFIFLVPFATGVLTVYSAPPTYRTNWLYALLMPVVSITMGIAFAGVLWIEALICLLMAAPIMIVMAMLGGLVVALIQRSRARQSGSVVAAMLLLPYLFAPIENAMPVEKSFHTVETQIVINADADTVWQNIIRVTPIQDAERPTSVLFDWFNAPKPMEATLEKEGVGGIRRGKFVDGLQFVETIKMWSPPKRITWEIVPDITSATLAPWIGIGGKYFAVPDASYWIEPDGDSQVILHLSSTHTLTTRLNGYGALWTEWGMREFQNYILRIIKTRVEKR
jgi:hypothetical protein